MNESSSVVRRLVQSMPKAELHLHLDGCLRPVTALELARKQGVDAPASWRGMFGALVAPARPGSQAELLRSFALPLALMQHRDALARVTTELVEDKAADRVKYLEIKWAPAFHRAGGLTLDQVIDTVAQSAADAGRRLGVEVRLTVTAIRADTADTNVAVARAAVAHREQGVTGFDLAGYEASDPDPRVHAAAFDVARAGGLGITVHAGELPHSAALVRQALDVDPGRIAHGASAVDDPALLLELIARGVTLDLCPTSNVQAGTVARFADHPLPMLLRAGVSVTINTDDTTISDVTLSEEWSRCIDELGLTLPEIWMCNLQAVHAAFVDEHTRRRLLDEFHAWAQWVPELSPTPG